MNIVIMADSTAATPKEVAYHHNIIFCFTTIFN
jgi:fatty acid-binding protein DegV